MNSSIRKLFYGKQQFVMEDFCNLLPKKSVGTTSTMILMSDAKTVGDQILNSCLHNMSANEPLAKFLFFVLFNVESNNQTVSKARLFMLEEKYLNHFRFLSIFFQRFVASRDDNSATSHSHFNALVHESDLTAMFLTRFVVSANSFSKKFTFCQNNFHYLIPAFSIDLECFDVSKTLDSDFLRPLQPLCLFDVMEGGIMQKTDMYNNSELFVEMQSNANTCEKLIHSVFSCEKLFDFLLLTERFEPLSETLCKEVDNLFKRCCTTSNLEENDQVLLFCELANVLIQNLALNGVASVAAGPKSMLNCLFKLTELILFDWEHGIIKEEMFEETEIAAAYANLSKLLQKAARKIMPLCASLFLQYLVSRQIWKGFRVMQLCPTRFMSIDDLQIELRNSNQTLPQNDEKTFFAVQNLLTELHSLDLYHIATPASLRLTKKEDEQEEEEKKEDEKEKEEKEKLIAVENRWIIQKPEMSLTNFYNEQAVGDVVNTVLLPTDPIDDSLWQCCPEVYDPFAFAASAKLYLVGGSVSRALRRKRPEQDSFYSDFDLIIFAKSGRSLYQYINLCVTNIANYLISRHGHVWQYDTHSNIITFVAKGFLHCVSVSVRIDETIEEYLANFDLSHAQCAYYAGNVSLGQKKSVVASLHCWMTSMFSHGSLVMSNNNRLKRERLAKLYALRLPLLSQAKTSVFCRNLDDEDEPAAPKNWWDDTESAIAEIENWHKDLLIVSEPWPQIMRNASAMMSISLTSALPPRQESPSKKRNREEEEEEVEPDEEKDEEEQPQLDNNLLNFALSQNDSDEMAIVKRLDSLAKRRSGQSQSAVTLTRNVSSFKEERISQLISIHGERTQPYLFRAPRDIFTDGWKTRLQRILLNSSFDSTLHPDAFTSGVIFFAYYGSLKTRFAFRNLSLFVKNDRVNYCTIYGHVIDSILETVPTFDLFDKISECLRQNFRRRALSAFSRHTGSVENNATERKERKLHQFFERGIGNQIMPFSNSVETTALTVSATMSLECMQMFRRQTNEQSNYTVDAVLELKGFVLNATNDASDPYISLDFLLSSVVMK